jgi:hypothetical protein
MVSCGSARSKSGSQFAWSAISIGLDEKCELTHLKRTCRKSTRRQRPQETVRQVLRIARPRSGQLALTDTGGLPPRMRPFSAACSRSMAGWSGRPPGSKPIPPRSVVIDGYWRRDDSCPGCTTRYCVSGWCRSIATLHGVVFAIFTASRSGEPMTSPHRLPVPSTAVVARATRHNPGLSPARSCGRSSDRLRHARLASPGAVLSHPVSPTGLWPRLCL